MRLAQRPQRSDAFEARNHGPSVSSQALYHWATVLDLGVKFTQNIAKYPLHHVTYAAAKFETIMSNSFLIFFIDIYAKKIN